MWGRQPPHPPAQRSQIAKAGDGFTITVALLASFIAMLWIDQEFGRNIESVAATYEQPWLIKWGFLGGVAAVLYYLCRLVIALAIMLLSGFFLSRFGALAL